MEQLALSHPVDERVELIEIVLDRGACDVV